MLAQRTTFKRVDLDGTFIIGDTKYRKCGNRVAFRVLPNGTGQTHKKITFAKTASVVVVP